MDEDKKNESCNNCLFAEMTFNLYYCTRHKCTKGAMEHCELWCEQSVDSTDLDFDLSCEFKI